jgi:hypothetical protein
MPRLFLTRRSETVEEGSGRRVSAAVVGSSVLLADCAESAPANPGALPVQDGGRGRPGHLGRAGEELVPHQVMIFPCSSA